MIGAPPANFDEWVRRMANKAYRERLRLAAMRECALQISDHAQRHGHVTERVLDAELDRHLGDEYEAGRLSLRLRVIRRPTSPRSQPPNANAAARASCPGNPSVHLSPRRSSPARRPFRKVRAGAPAISRPLRRREWVEMILSSICAVFPQATVRTRIVRNVEGYR